MRSVFKKLCLIALTLFSLTSAYAIATVGTITNNKINLGSGNGYIIVNGITSTSAVTVTAQSSNNTILSIVGVNYTSGQKVAIVNVKEFGIAGAVTVTITANDGILSESKVFDITIADLSLKGCILGIYDIVFWSHTMPTQSENSLKDIILPTSRNTLIDDNNGPYKGLSLTQGAPTSNGNYAIAITNRLKGYFTPTVTGYYLFEGRSTQGITFNLYFGDEISPNQINKSFVKQINARAIEKSTFVTTLLGGKTYGFMAASHNYNAVDFGVWYGYAGATPPVVTNILLEQNTVMGVGNQGYNIGYLTPTIAGLDMQLMGGNMLAPYSDFKKPQLYGSLKLVRKNTTSMDFKWNKSIDPDPSTNSGVKGYNIYVDGVLKFAINKDSDTTKVLNGLVSGQNYTVFYTAIDVAGNESLPSNILSEPTFLVETTAPNPPTIFNMVQQGDVSVKISWAGATDNASGIYGYNIYVDGSTSPYNGSIPFNGTTTSLKIFAPNSAHTYIIKSVDGNLNESLASAEQSFTTTSFNVNTPSPDAKKLAMTISTNYIGKSEGLGLNGANCDRNGFVGSSLAVHKDLAPSMVRWGGLDANKYSFESKSGSSPVQYKDEGNATFAEFINFATSIGAYAEIVIGTDNSNPAIDWRTAPEATMRKFIGYLQGNTTISGANKDYNEGVQIRIDEGLTQAPLSNPNFKGLVLELGCEPWGGTNNGGQSDHSADGFNNFYVYGDWARSLAKAAKEVPGFDSTKIKLYYSGREPQLVDSYGLHQELLGTNKADYVDGLTLGGYFGGNLNLVKDIDPGKSEIEYYKNGIEKAAKNLNGLLQTMQLDLKMTSIVPSNAPRAGRMRPTLFYESDYSTPSFNKRYGQSLVMMDYYLSTLSYGHTIPCLFALGESQWGFTELGVKMPRYYFMRLLNRFVKSNILGVASTSVEVIKNSAGESIDLKPVSTHAYHTDGKYVVVLISRDFENDFEVELNIPAGFLPTMNPMQVSGKKYVVSSGVVPNFSSKDFKLDSSNIVVSNKMVVTVPKYGLVLITFSGNTLPNKPLALGYTNYLKPTSLTVANANTVDGGENITSDLDAMQFTVTLTPNTPGVNNKLKWEILKSSQYQEVDAFLLSTNVFKAQALGCQSQGMVTVVGTLIDNPNFSFTKSFNISGQNRENGTPCPPGALKAQSKNTNLPFKVYPMPSTGIVKLLSGVVGNVSIFTAQGQVLFSTEITKIDETISVDLEQGIYYAKLSTDKGSTTRKIVVTK